VAQMHVSLMMMMMIICKFDDIMKQFSVPIYASEVSKSSRKLAF